METERIVLLFLALVGTHALIIWMHRHTDKKVLESLATYHLYAGYQAANSPLVKRRAEQFKTSLFGIIGATAYFIGFGCLLVFLGGEIEVNKALAIFACAFVGCALGTGFVFLATLLSLADGKRHLLNEIIDESRLAVILMSKHLHTPHVYGWRIQDEKLVKKLLEAMPIIDELCRLNELREGIEGKADTEARKQTLAELETLIDLKNAELMPYVDIVFASVGATNPLDEAESDFNKVAKEIALAKSKTQES